MKNDFKTSRVDPETDSVAILAGYPRVFLILLFCLNLILGVLFYALPTSMISYWPWPVKVLAARFLGAIFLAISLGCWSAVDAQVWQRAKILVLVGAAFFMLTGIVSLVRGITVTGSDMIWPWTGFFLVAGIGCMLVLMSYGWHRTKVEPISQSLSGGRIFFGIQTSVVGVFGAMMMLLPSVAQDQFWPWKVATPTLQTFGALFLATCLATGWAFLQKNNARIIVLLPLDAIFPSLALIAVGIGWSTIVAESPSWLVTAVWLFLYSFVAVGSTGLYVIIRMRSRAPL